MTFINEDGNETTDTQYDGSAPLAVTFTANPENVGNYTPLYEWRFTRKGESKPFSCVTMKIRRYTFTQSGSFSVELLISFVQGTDTMDYVMDQAFV